MRSGRAMAFFYENEVKIKIWSRPAPVKLTYGDIVEAFREKFSGVLQEEKDWWAAVYAPEKEEEKREPTEKPEQHTAGLEKQRRETWILGLTGRRPNRQERRKSSRQLRRRKNQRRKRKKTQ